MTRQKKWHVGTAGWEYYDWKGRFYPAELPARERLTYYAQHFNCVEVNVTFYRFVKASTSERWAQTTPEHFCFIVKLHRYFTHLKRLAFSDMDEAAEMWRRWFEGVRPLEGRLLAILVQLPPALQASREGMELLVSLMRNGFDGMICVEGRHSTWLEEETLSWVRELGLVWVFSQAGRWRSVETATSEWVYYRFHGPERLYMSSYSEEQLAGYARRFRELAVEGGFAIFNNTYRAIAVENAKTFMRFLGGV